MSKPFPYWFRLLTVSSLGFFLTVNPAMAGRLLQRNNNRCVPVECQPCVPIVCNPSVHVPSCCDVIATESLPTVPDCGCDVPSSSMEHSAPPAQTFEPQQSENTAPPVVPPKVIEPKTVEPKPMPPKVIAPDPVPAPAPEVKKPDPALEPKVIDPPVVDPVPAANPPKVDPPKVDPPKVDPMPEEKVDDLFGDEPEAAPEKPAVIEEEKPAANDDLFGDAPAEPAMNEEPALVDPPAADPIEPAADPVDPPAADNDLFGDAPADGAADMPKADDDLFKDAPAEPAVPADGGDDLFGDAAAEQPKADGDDLFNDPPAADEKAEEPAKEAEDDLFGNPAAADDSNDSLDDLFSVNNQPIFKGAEFRAWEDNTGNFSVRGRLSTIYPDKVKLLKENGKFSTVPMRRLSDADKLYVQWVAVQLGQKTEYRFVNTQSETNTK